MKWFRPRPKRHYDNSSARSCDRRDNLLALIGSAISYAREHPEMSREDIVQLYRSYLEAMSKLSDAELAAITRGEATLRPMSVEIGK